MTTILFKIVSRRATLHGPSLEGAWRRRVLKCSIAGVVPLRIIGATVGKHLGAATLQNAEQDALLQNSETWSSLPLLAALGPP